MILIVSEPNDQSTDKVMSHIKKDVIRINSNDPIVNIDINITGETDKLVILTRSGIKVDFIDVKSYWYRRGKIKFFVRLLENAKHIYQKKEYLNQEWRIVEDYLYSRANKVFSISSYYAEASNNKLIDLHNAKNAGLMIPDSKVCTNKESLMEFYGKYEKIISKPLSNHLSSQDDDYLFEGNSLTIVDKSNLILLGDNFFPCYVQKYILKKVEIRCFFFYGNLCASAIFSQNDEKTKYNYKNYNRSSPNRCVPFELPREVKLKINKFMNTSNLNSGTLDLILNKEGEYVFLEVNPVGQFGWISQNCNFEIEYLLAESLKQSSPVWMT